MAIIYRTTLIPSKLELLAEWLPSRPWYAGPGRAPSLAKAGGFRLDDPDGEVGIEFLVALDTSGDGPVAYHVPMTYRSVPLRDAEDALIGTTVHGVLGRRWVYDGTRDPVFARQLVALIQGAAEPQAQSISDAPDPTVLTRPVLANSLVPRGAFRASDDANGTRVRADAGAAGELVVSVERVLRAGGAPDSSGHVTATWRPAGDTTVRGVFATAGLGDWHA